MSKITKSESNGVALDLLVEQFLVCFIVFDRAIDQMRGLECALHMGFFYACFCVVDEWVGEFC